MTGPMDLRSILENAARRSGDKTAIIFGERRVSFARLEEDANRFAHALIKMGVKKGDRVAILLANNPEFIVVFFGIMKAGAIAVPLDTRYVVDELKSLCDDCTPVVFIIEEPPLASLLTAIHEFRSVQHVITLNYQEDGRFTSYRQIMAENPPSSIQADIDPDDIAIISYTGGPTYKPHGVAISHRSAYTEAINSAATFEQTADDMFMLFALPMYHQFGLTAVLLASIYTGNTIVVVPGTGRSIESFMEAVEREKGTMYCGVPYIYSLMVNVAKRVGVKHDLSSLRLLASGGAPLEPVVIKQFKKYYGLDIRDIYGQTESICHVTVMPIHGKGRIGSSGKTLACWEMKIFDENDNEMPSGQIGEIVLRGPVMSSFYGKPEATARTLRNGWLHTGDMGWIDEEGYLFITERKRRMLILKGQNIFPADIEAVLETHPKIAEARVMGSIDLIRGETVKAIVRLKPGETATEQEIRQYCQGRLADYKLPREVTFVDVMPEVIPLWRRMKFKEEDVKLEISD
ncbi:MAG: AMP-binding protein [Dehalococcoidales bacterium]|nr:AMP-binding protein [Dehalococcoidales bacterium]